MTHKTETLRKLRGCTFEPQKQRLLDDLSQKTAIFNLTAILKPYPSRNIELTVSRSIAGIIALVLIILNTPITLAHDEPPEASGLVLSLSGSGGDLDLIRQTTAEAQIGSVDIHSGAQIDIGIWISEPISNLMKITEADLMVVMYALPIGPVVGDGITFNHVVSIDGVEVASGTSEQASLIEPLIWTAVPWFIPNLNITAELGQTIELQVSAYVEGIGSVRVQWGDNTDSPATMSLENWRLERVDSIIVADEEKKLEVEFSTPWNCSDIESVTLKTKGPVDDHDMAWLEAPVAQTRELHREICKFHLNLEGLTGIHLSQWNILMTDGETVNQSAYFIVTEDLQVINVGPLYVNILGGMMGALLGCIFLVAGVGRNMNPAATAEFGKSVFKETFQDGLTIEQGAVLGLSLLVGVLTNLTITIFLFAILYASLWSINAET